MPNSENGIPSVLSEIMKSPEAMGIIDALKERTDEEKKDAPGNEGGDFSLPPDFLEKLPAVMSALAGTGLFPPPKKETGLIGGDRGRKALLKALRPYLCKRRQAVVDSLIGLDTLSGLLGASGKERY